MKASNFESECRGKFDEIDHHLDVNDQKLDTIFQTLEQHDDRLVIQNEERETLSDELRDARDSLRLRIDHQGTEQTSLSHSIDEKYGLKVKKLDKEVQMIRVDFLDAVDSQSDRMAKRIEEAMKQARKEFSDMVTQTSEVQEQLITLHKRKAKKIKTVLADNIARMQTRLDQVNVEYQQISDLGHEWRQIHKHSFSLDAKVYTMESTLAQVDNERSQQ